MALQKQGASGYNKPKGKKSSQGVRKQMIKKSSMNKNRKRSWKAYNGQGK